MIHTLYYWPDQEFTYARIAKCYSSTLTNHLCQNDTNNIQVAEVPSAGPVFMPIRHPVDRVASHYSRTYWKKYTFEEYVDQVLNQGLAERDPHVAPYVESTKLATHVRPVEYMEQWWNEFYVMRPGIFGDYPSRIANRSKDEHRPDHRLVQYLRAEISSFYELDLQAWNEACDDYRTSPFPV